MDYDFIGRTKEKPMSYLSAFGYVNLLVNGHVDDSHGVHVAQSRDMRYSTFWWRGKFVGRHDNNSKIFYENTLFKKC